VNLAAASTQFDEVLRVSTHSKLRGQITNLDDGTASFAFPVRRLLVDPKSPAAGGMEVVTAGGFRYLLAEQGDDFMNGVVKRAFLMVRLDRSDEVNRKTSTIDPATLLKKDDQDVSQGTIWYQARSLRINDGVLQVPEAKYQILTGFPLQAKDTVGGLRVLHVEHRLGVYFAEAQ
jgi:hypothetical protein